MRSQGGGNRRPPGERSTAILAVISVVIVLVLVVVGVAVWSVSHHPQHAASPPPTGRAHPTSPAAVASAGPLTPVSANSFDQTGSDDPGGAQYAIDGNPSTAWHTDYYFGSSTFGNLKKGTGLILDMGRQVRLTQVVVRFGTNCCTHVELKIGSNPSPSALSTFTELQNSTTAAGTTTFNVTSKTAGRYVLIWITDLPSTGNSSQYESFIYNVTVHGSAVSQSG
jgi:flagellar basal body-associated protein FliL